MHNALLNQKHEDHIRVRVSKIMVDELTRVGMWRDLRFPIVAQQNDGSAILTISIHDARDMVERCRACRARDDIRQGLPKAYTHVITNLLTSIMQFERRGLAADPGYDLMRKASDDCNQKFSVGDRCFCSFWQEVVTIKDRYGFYRVFAEDGKFFTEAGARFDYRWGYGIESAEGKKAFARAGALYEADYRLRHLVLVRKAGRAVDRAP